MNPEKMKILWLKAQTVYVSGIREDLQESVVAVAVGCCANAVLCVDDNIPYDVVGTEEQERRWLLERLFVVCCAARCGALEVYYARYVPTTSRIDELWITMNFFPFRFL
jgi:hypothetical protein